MPSYVETIFDPGEQITYRAYLHWIVFALPIVLMLIGAAVLSFSQGTPPSVNRFSYRLFSRPALGAGLVALRQTFVRRCHGGSGSPGPAGNQQIRT